MTSTQLSLAALIPLGLRAAFGAYKYTGTCVHYDVIVVLAFGYVEEHGNGGRVIPGASNIYLAEFVASRQLSRPVIAQHELIEPLRRLAGVDPTFVISEATTGGYLDTYDFMAQASVILAKNKLKRPLVLAHPHHLPRVQAVANKLGIDATYEGGLQAVWEKHSAQRWTRGPLRWFIREVIAISVYRRRGYI